MGEDDKIISDRFVGVDNSGREYSISHLLDVHVFRDNNNEFTNHEIIYNGYKTDDGLDVEDNGTGVYVIDHPSGKIPVKRRLTCK